MGMLIMVITVQSAMKVVYGQKMRKNVLKFVDRTKWQREINVNAERGMEF